MQLIKGQEIAILTLQSVDFIAVVTTPQPPYIYNGSAVNPVVTLWDVKDKELVTVDPNDFIEDANDIIYQRIVGARPRNIVRR